jgi:hypothetical protein
MNELKFGDLDSMNWFCLSDDVGMAVIAAFCIYCWWLFGPSVVADEETELVVIVDDETGGLDLKSSFIDMMSLFCCLSIGFMSVSDEVDDDEDVTDELNERVGVKVTGSWLFSSRVNRLKSIPIRIFYFLLFCIFDKFCSCWSVFILY